MTAITVDRAVLEQALKALKPRSRICKRNAAITALCAALEQEEPIRPTVQEMQNAAANLKLMEEMFGGSTALAQEEPTRAQKMRDEGYTRRPTLREMGEREREDIAQNLQSRLNAALLLEGRRQEIAQPRRETEQEQAEPVLVVEKEPDYMSRGHFYEGSKPFIDPTLVWKLPIGTKLYTAPPRREWQGLTEEEILPLYNTTPSSHAEMLEFARDIEDALKEKNNG